MRQLAAFRKALVGAVTEDDIRAVTAELLRRARDGDVLAMRLLFAYVIGRPTDAVDPDTLDQQEWDLYRKHPARGQDVIDLMQTLPPHLACFLVRTTVPYVGQPLADGLREQFEAERAGADRAGGPAVEELLRRRSRACVLRPAIPTGTLPAADANLAEPHTPAGLFHAPKPLCRQALRYQSSVGTALAIPLPDIVLPEFRGVRDESKATR
jgi:hypothetical protein